MEFKGKRGSERLLAAWKARALSDDSVREIAQALEKSSASVEKAVAYGGANATGVQVSLSYSGDDIPSCGNDIQFWLQWLRRHGGAPRPPKVIINGIPFPDVVRVELDFGHITEGPLQAADLAEQLKGPTIRG